MSSSSDKLSERVASATQRLAALKARQLMREMRNAHLAKLRARRDERRQRLQFGGAVFIAQCTDFSPVEIVGLLLDGKERVGVSPTMRLAIRKKGQEWVERASPTSS